VSKTTGHYWLTQSGGVRPWVRRPRPPLRLSLEERETISRDLAQQKTFTAIAAEFGRSASTSREVARNSGPNGYRAALADRLAVQRMARPRPGRLAEDDRLKPQLTSDQFSVDTPPRVPPAEVGLLSDSTSSPRVPPAEVGLMSDSTSSPRVPPAEVGLMSDSTSSPRVPPSRLRAMSSG
jgi:hypothetical protein